MDVGIPLKGHGNMTLTPAVVQQLLKTYYRQILDQLGYEYENITLSIPEGDPDPYIRVSVLSSQVNSIPNSITIQTDQRSVTIPLKVFGDYKPFKLQIDEKEMMKKLDKNKYSSDFFRICAVILNQSITDEYIFTTIKEYTTDRYGVLGELTPPTQEELEEIEIISWLINSLRPQVSKMIESDYIFENFSGIFMGLPLAISSLPDVLKKCKEEGKNPSFDDILQQLEKEGRIMPAEAVQFRANYQYFENNRLRIQQQYKSQWVASLNQKLIVEPSLSSLTAIVQNEPDAKYAYIEQIL